MRSAHGDREWCKVSLKFIALLVNQFRLQLAYKTNLPASQREYDYVVLMYITMVCLKQNVDVSTGKCSHFTLVLPHRQIKYPVDFDDEL